MQTVLITGGAGFIGSHLIDKLINQYKIICIDNFSDYYSPAIKKRNIQHNLNNENFCLYNADITDKEALNKIFQDNKIDVIVHIAAMAGVRNSIINPELYANVNVNGTLNLLEFARINKINKFVFASSSSVYANQGNGPFNEEMNVNRPISPYAATKMAGEQICYTYSHLYDIQINCLRFFTVYGPRQRPDLAIHKFSKLIYENKPIPVYGDGSTKRDYTYIEDIIDGVIRAIAYDKTRFEIFNLGESQTVQLDYLISILEKYLDQKAIIDRLSMQPGDMENTYADISKAKSILGYNPTTNIESGLKIFIDWFKKN
ncbi:MAG: GDP-mannose 4,6-dehydratase [Candidatus Gastranaerophilaceae bacterium]|jgi:UDP-glucuronate 4-epimerase